MKKIAILLDSTRPSQKSISAIKSLNSISSEYSNTDTTIFCKHHSIPAIIPRFGIMHEAMAYFHDAYFFSTDISTTMSMIKFPQAKKRFFYVWDLEWLSLDWPFAQLKEPYLNQDVELIARSKSHYDLISSVWKSPVAIMKDFNKDTVQELVGEQK